MCICSGERGQGGERKERGRVERKGYKGIWEGGRGRAIDVLGIT